MSDLSKAIYEHLITKRKYNKLKIKLEVAREEIQRLNVEIRVEKLKHQKKYEEWEKALKEQEEQIIKLKKRDYIYYDYIIEKIKPKKIRWKLYCWFRSMITIQESPSKIHIYLWESHATELRKGLEKEIEVE